VIGQKFKDILGFESSGGGCCQMRFFASENSEILSPYLPAVHISKLHLRIIYVYIYNIESQVSQLRHCVPFPLPLFESQKFHISCILSLRFFFFFQTQL